MFSKAGAADAYTGSERTASDSRTTMNAPMTPQSQPTEHDSALDALCRRFGVISEYTDIWGGVQHASEETRLALLKALGALDETDDIQEALRRHEARAWRRVAPRVAVFRVDE